MEREFIEGIWNFGNRGAERSAMYDHSRNFCFPQGNGQLGNSGPTQKAITLQCHSQCREMPAIFLLWQHCHNVQAHQLSLQTSSLTNFFNKSVCMCMCIQKVISADIKIK